MLSGECRTGSRRRQHRTRKDMPMSKKTETEMAVILQKHGMRLCSEEGGKRADLRGADLSAVSLRYARLVRARLSHADLRGVRSIRG